MPIKITKEYYQKGDDILICASTDITQNYYSSKLDDWINNVIRVIQSQTDRKITIRNKNETIPLDTHLKNACCVITPQSTVVIEALCKGIPCIDSSYGCGVDVTSKSLDLNELFYPDEDLLYNWLCTLNNYSFTREEISSGFAWSKINDNK